MPDTWDELYEVSINELGLSEHALDMLNSVGVTSIGDCLDHFSRYGSGASMLFRLGFLETMETEVIRKLVERGYITPEAAINFGYAADE